jgi:hypothetical protein
LIETGHKTRSLMAVPSRRTDRFIALAVGLLAFALYAATAAPSVATLFDDSLEFQVVLPTLSIAHPSGYPLYTLLGKLATLLVPFRDAAGRANLFSAAAAGATIGLLYLICRNVAGSRAAALVAAAAFALSPAWWSQATIAEVYALNGLLMAAFLYLLLRWESEPARGFQIDSKLNLAALVAGLGMAHHRTMALLFPAALIFIFWTDPALLRQPRRWIAPLALFAAPLLLYLYLPIRGRAVTSLDGTYAPTFAGTLDWILARPYSVFLTGNPFNVNRGLNDALGLIFSEMGALIPLAAVFGLFAGWHFSRRRVVFLGVALLTELLFAANYKVQDIAVFYIPAFMLIAICAAWGLAPVFDGLTQRAALSARPFHMRPWARRVFALAWVLPLAAIVLFEPVRAAARDFEQRDLSRAWNVYDYGADMVASPAEDGQVVGLLGETTLIRYFRDVLGERRDITVVPADAEAARDRAVDAALAAGVPVYLTRDLPGASARYSLDAAGPLIAVSPKATPGPPPHGQRVGDSPVLWLDGKAFVRPARAGRTVRIEAAWTAAEPLAEDLRISARLVSEDGAPAQLAKAVAATDTVPVHFTYPTTSWVVGETVNDVYDLLIPDDAPAGRYKPLIIVYRGADGSEIGQIELPALVVPGLG